VPLPGRVSVKQLSAAIRSAILSNGFEINPEKVWFSGPKSRKEVTGLIVNEFTNVKRSFVRNLRAALYKIETMGVAPAEKDYQKRYKTAAPLEQILRGRLEWIAQVRGRSFSAYRTLAKRFNRQFPASALPILPTYAEIAERAVWVLEFFVDDVCEQGTAFFLEGVGLVTADHVLEKLPTGEHAVLYRPSEPTKKFKAIPSSRRCPHRDLSILDHGRTDRRPPKSAASDLSRTYKRRDSRTGLSRLRSRRSAGQTSRSYYWKCDQARSENDRSLRDLDRRH
jgi:RNA-directed DNA polymerase